MVSKLRLNGCGGRVGSGWKDGLMILLFYPALFVCLNSLAALMMRICDQQLFPLQQDESNMKAVYILGGLTILLFHSVLFVCQQSVCTRIYEEPNSLFLQD